MGRSREQGGDGHCLSRVNALKAVSHFQPLNFRKWTDRLETRVINKQRRSNPGEQKSAGKPMRKALLPILSTHRKSQTKIPRNQRLTEVSSPKIRGKSRWPVGRRKTVKNNIQRSYRIVPWSSCKAFSKIEADFFGKGNVGLFAGKHSLAEGGI